MKKTLCCLFLLSVLTLLVGCQNEGGAGTAVETAQTEPTTAVTPTADPAALINAETFAANERLGRGINFGNALEGPNEGAWGLYLRQEYFEDIAAAGFDSVRVPINWSTHAGITEPYTVDEAFFERIDWVIEQALANDLAVVINAHNFEPMMQMPEQQAVRLTEIWRQIAERYQDQPDTVYFELLNEPHEKLDNAIWNTIFPDVLAAIRETNPERYVIIGPDSYNDVGRLDGMELPEDDRRIIATFHYYSPHTFTHQGAPWTDSGDSAADDTPWGSEEEMQTLIDRFDAALAWSEAEQRPLYVGEFGVYYEAPEDSRMLWTSTVVEEAEKRGFSWAYWEFGTSFGVYNLVTKEWREPLFSALSPDS